MGVLGIILFIFIGALWLFTIGLGIATWYMGGIISYLFLIPVFILLIKYNCGWCAINY